jgi:hypothetical protein
MTQQEDVKFVPTRLEPVSDDYPTDELALVYKELYEKGLFIREFGPGPDEGGDGPWMAGVGSYYLLQQLELAYPEAGEINPADLSLGDCVNLSAPGMGDTRIAAIRDGERAFMSLEARWPEHQEWHRIATSAT